jgi:hypothetical protein
MIQIEMAKHVVPIFRQDALYSVGLLVLSIVGIIGPWMTPGYKGREGLYEALAAVIVCALTCAWAGLKVLRGIR